MTNPTVKDQEKSSTRKLAGVLATVSALAVSGALCVNTSFKTKEPITCPPIASSVTTVEAPKPAYVDGDGRCDWKAGEKGKDCDNFTIGNRVYDLGIEDDVDSPSFSSVDQICEDMLKGKIKTPPMPRIEIFHRGIKNEKGEFTPHLVVGEVQWRRIFPTDPLREEKDDLGRKGVKVVYNKDATDQGVGSMKYSLWLDCGDQAPVYEKPEGPVICDFSSAQANSLSAEHLRDYAGYALRVIKSHRSDIVGLVGEPERLDVRISGKILMSGIFVPATITATVPNGTPGTVKSVDLSGILKSELTRDIEPPPRECFYTIPLGIPDFSKAKPKPAEPESTTPAESNSAK